MEQYKTEAKPKAWAGDVPVMCAHDEIVDIAKLVPNPKNPNKHPDSQIQALGKIIRQTGWRAPITVSTRSGFIVKGHGRLAAAMLEDMRAVPVDYQNYTSEAEEFADLVADNRIAELAEIDQRMLADIFADIDTGEIPLEATGYNEEEVERLITALSEALHVDLDETEGIPEDIPDDIPEPPTPEKRITKKGDLWILGSYRVMCGKFTNEADVKLLYDGAKAEKVLTGGVLDVFGGSGTTLAAKTGSKPSYIMDANPGFVDVIVRLYIKVTGKTSGIRLFRKGKELGREQFAAIFEE